MEYLGTNKLVNKTKPLVSVCVQTFQHIKFIEACLDSIVHQETNFPYEILVGEDCSTDGTREVCIAYAEKYPDKIRLFLRDLKSKITIEDRASGRKNYLENFRTARGKYISVVDGDDYFINSKKLQIQYDIMEANPNCAVTGCDTVYTYDGEPIIPMGSTYSIDIKRIITKYSGVFHFGPSSSRLFRNDVETFINSTTILTTRVFDIPLLQYLLNKGDFYISKENLVAYRIHDNGQNSGDKNLLAKSNFYNIFSSLYKEGLIGFGQFSILSTKNYVRMGYIFFSILSNKLKQKK